MSLFRFLVALSLSTVSFTDLPALLSYDTNYTRVMGLRKTPGHCRTRAKGHGAAAEQTVKHAGCIRVAGIFCFADHRYNHRLTPRLGPSDQHARAPAYEHHCF